MDVPLALKILGERTDGNELAEEALDFIINLIASANTRWHAAEDRYAELVETVSMRTDQNSRLP